MAGILTGGLGKAPFPGRPYLHDKRPKLEALVQWAIYKNQSQPLLALLPPSLPNLFLPPPCPEGPAPPAQPSLTTWPPFIGVSESLAFPHHPAKATGSSYQMHASCSAPPFQVPQEGVLRLWLLVHHSSEQTRAPLEWSHGGGGGLQQLGAHPCLPFPRPQGQGGSAGPSGM